MEEDWDIEEVPEEFELGYAEPDEDETDWRPESWPAAA